VPNFLALPGHAEWQHSLLVYLPLLNRYLCGHVKKKYMWNQVSKIFSVAGVARNVLFLKKVGVTMGVRGKIMKYSNIMSVYRT